jgi:hypothetical protein
VSTTQKKPEGRPGEQGLNALYFVCHAHASVLGVFLRHGFGRDALGLPSLAGVGMMFLTYAARPDLPMLAFMLCWLAAQVAQRVRTFRLLRRGVALHSRYPGTPWLARKMPFVRSDTAAKKLEPPLCLLAGLACLPLSPSLACFLAAGFFSLLIRHGMDEEVVRKHVQRMRDAEIEQKNVWSRYRDE